MKVNWRDIVFAAVMIILFFAFLRMSFGDPVALFKIPEMNLCSEYLQQGTIFQGQPYCGQGMATYVFSFILRRLSGGADISIPLYLFVLVLLNLHALFLILRIVQNETGKREYLLTGILYLSMVYIFGSYLTSFLVLYFCITGFYVLWHSKLKFRNILGPVLYACALLSKPNAMPIVAFLVCHMAYRTLQPRIVSKKLVFNNAWKSAGIQLLSFGLVIAAVFLLFPNSWLYEFGNQANYQVNILSQFHQLIDKLLDSIILTSNSMFFGLLFLLSVVAWYFLRDIYSSVTVFSIAAWFWIFFNVGEVAVEYWPDYIVNGFHFAISRIDYYSPAFPFFIVAMAKLKQKTARTQWKWVIGALLALFLLPSIEFAMIHTDIITANTNVIVSHDLDLLEEHFKKALSLIPYQPDDYVLTEDQLDDILIDKYYDPKVHVDVIPHKIEIDLPDNKSIFSAGVGPANPAFSFMIDKVRAANSSGWAWKENVEPDPAFSFMLYKMHVMNLSDWVVELPSPQEYIQPYDPIHNKTHNLFFSRLLNNSYTIILVNVLQRTSIINMIKRAPNVANYCQVMLPDLQYHTRQGVHGISLLFRDKVRCSQFLNKVKNYYDASFADICAKSPIVANEVVKYTLGLHKIPLPECKESATDPLHPANNPEVLASQRSSKLRVYARIFSLFLGIFLVWIAWVNNILLSAARHLAKKFPIFRKLFARFSK